MLDPFKAVSDYVKVGLNKTSIDDIVFKLHYRATVVLLMISTVLVTQRQYIGEHIRCISDTGVPENVINTFCFFSSTFTVVKNFDESSLAAGNLPHPGVGPHAEEEDDVVHHAYYQWVPFVLFLQAVFFYIPHYIWRKKEGGRLQALVSGLRMAYTLAYEEDQQDNNFVIPSRENVENRIKQLKIEFSNRLHVSRAWSYWLVGCEILNLLNLILQVYLTDLFLGGYFINLGVEVWKNPGWDTYMDPLDVVFPKATKCVFYKYGASGSIQNHDALCVMALNVIHEKIYTILWFWYLFLFICTMLGLLNRIIIYALHSRSARFNEFMFSFANSEKLNIKNIITVTHECHFGDWFFLYFLARNMNAYTFRIFFKGLAEELDDKTNSSNPMRNSSENVEAGDEKENSYEDDSLVENIKEK